MSVSSILRRLSSRGAKCAAVIVAAGSAERMQGTDKIMADLGGEPLIAATIRAFESCDDVVQIVVVTRPDLCEPISELCVAKHFSKVTRVCEGGETRAASVQKGLERVSDKCGLVAIHDGARPLVPVRVIHDAIRKAAKFSAAAPVIPVKDTVKVVRGGMIESTPDRSTLYAVQTPQVFDRKLYRAALEQALGGKGTFTDDCSVAEAYGVKIIVTQGSEENLKVTTPEDLVLVRALYAERNKP